MATVFENLLMKNLNKDINNGPSTSILKKQSGQQANKAMGLHKDKPKPYHLHGMRTAGVTDMARKSQNLIAAVHKPDMEEVPLVRMLLDKPSGFGVVQSPTHIQMIVRRWNLKDLDEKNPKMLGNTGIMIFFDPNHNAYCLRKGG